MVAHAALSDENRNGTKITNLGDGTGAGDATNKGQLDTALATALSRANHTGTQTSATISDFDTRVRTSRLDQMSAPTGPVALGGQRLTGVADPTAAQDAATRGYVDVALSGLTSGLTIKGSVRVAATVDVSLSAPGAVIDGVTLASGDVVLLAGQTAGAQNGPHVWSGAASALVRASNFDSSAEATLGSFWIVREGTHADAFAVLTNDAPITLGTTALTFAFRGNGTSTGGFTTTIPATAAGGSAVVTHNLGTRAVITQVARTASPYDVVDVRVERTSTSTVTVLPDVAVVAAEFEIMIMRVA